jgi:acetate---CoA ligase (ADP-forming)
MGAHPLEVLMAPRSIVVLGASPRESSLGNTVVRNLLNFDFPGPVYPVHPKAPEVCGIPAFADMSAVPGSPECAIVCLSADKIIPSLTQAHRKGVKSAVIFASGFAEAGADGRALQADLQDFALRTGMKICGPNCLGIANLARRIPLYSAATSERIRRGDVAVLSHSGSGCIVLSGIGRFGISHLVSVGNGAVVDIDQYLDYLASDEATRVAALFIETIRNPPAFAAAARKMLAAGKHIIALKIGRSQKGVAATSAHTGALSGTAEVYDDFFKSCGVIAVDDEDELVEAIVLASSSRPTTGTGVAVVNVSGGEVALTCDMAQRLGIEFPELAPATKERLASVLPSFAHATNPLDVTGVAVFDMAMYTGAIEALAADPAVALVAVSQDCPAGLDPQQAEVYRTIATAVAGLAPKLAKPVVFYSNVAGGIHPRVSEPLVAAGVPLLQGARAALLAIDRQLHRPKMIAPPVDVTVAADPAWRKRFATGEPLTEREAKTFLGEHGLPVTREALATSARAAGQIAADLSWPVVLKIESPDIAHKSDIGGVRLGLSNVAEVEAAYAEIVGNAARRAPAARLNGVLVQEMVPAGVEVIVGVTRQEPFGMALVAGAGGVLVELVRDSALALAPVSESRARDLIAATRVSRLLGGFRGRPAGDIDALAALLARLSQVAAAYADDIEAIDLNPVCVGEAGKGVRIVDALLIPRRPAPH